MPRPEPVLVIRRMGENVVISEEDYRSLRKQPICVSHPNLKDFTSPESGGKLLKKSKMNLEFDENALEDLKYWVEIDRRKALKSFLIEEL